jgi:hypothetical protein
LALYFEKVKSLEIGEVAKIMFLANRLRHDLQEQLIVVMISRTSLQAAVAWIATTSIK